MTLQGHIKNGGVVFEKALPLPDGTPVTVEIHDVESAPTLADQLGDIIGIVSDLPEDMAKNHDHYVHKTSKK